MWFWVDILIWEVISIFSSEKLNCSDYKFNKTVSKHFFNISMWKIEFFSSELINFDKNYCCAETPHSLMENSSPSPKIIFSGFKLEKGLLFRIKESYISASPRKYLGESEAWPCRTTLNTAHVLQTPAENCLVSSKIQQPDASTLQRLIRRYKTVHLCRTGAWDSAKIPRNRDEEKLISVLKHSTVSIL